MGLQEDLQAAADQEEKIKKIEKIKAHTMSYASRVKPFFIEFDLVSFSTWLERRITTRGMINGSLIESYSPFDRKDPSKGTNIKFIFGETQLVAESVDEVTAKMQQALSNNYT